MTTFVDIRNKVFVTHLFEAQRFHGQQVLLSAFPDQLAAALALVHHWIEEDASYNTSPAAMEKEIAEFKDTVQAMLDKCLNPSEPQVCTHPAVTPPFDAIAAAKMKPAVVRASYPRFFARCPDCGTEGLRYASEAHRVAGGWE